jgi:hypothetical protein
MGEIGKGSEGLLARARSAVTAFNNSDSDVDKSLPQADGTDPVQTPPKPPATPDSSIPKPPEVETTPPVTSVPPSVLETPPASPQQESPAEFIPTGLGLFGELPDSVQHNLQNALWFCVGCDTKKYKEIAEPMLNIQKICEGIQDLTQETSREQRESIYKLVTGLNKIQKGLVNSEQMDVFLGVLGASENSFQKLVPYEFKQLKKQALTILTKIQNDIKAQHPTIGQVEEGYGKLIGSPNVIGGALHTGLSYAQEIFALENTARKSQQEGTFTPDIQKQIQQEMYKVGQPLRRLLNIQHIPGYYIKEMGPVFTAVLGIQDQARKEIESKYPEIYAKLQQQGAGLTQEEKATIESINQSLTPEYNRVMQEYAPLTASLILRMQAENQQYLLQQAQPTQQPTTPAQSPAGGGARLPVVSL